MSRHRHVRSMNYEDEYYDDDDIYGHSVEDNYCISPGTAAQFTYNRERHVDLANYMGEAEGIPEEEEEEEDHHSHSQDCTRPKLNDLDNAKLNSCLEEVRNVLGEAVPEHIMIETIMRHGFKLDSSLNELLNQQDAPKPQREKRENRRKRSQEFDDVSDFTPKDNNDFDENSENIMSFVLPHLGGKMTFGPGTATESDYELIGGTPCSLLSASLAEFHIKGTPVKTTIGLETDRNYRKIGQSNSHEITVAGKIDNETLESSNECMKSKGNEIAWTQENYTSEQNRASEQTTSDLHNVEHSRDIYSQISGSLSGLILSHNISRSQNCTSTIQDTDSQLGKMNQQAANNDSELCKGTEKLKVHSLTTLSTEDKEKTTTATSESTVKRDFSLAELGRSHMIIAKPMTSLSELAKQKKDSKITSSKHVEDCNQTKTLLNNNSQYSDITTKLGTLSVLQQGVKSKNEDTKQTISQFNTESLSLQDLAKVNRDKQQGDGQSSCLYSKQQGPSLKDLAKVHGPSGKTVSLLDLAIAHGVNRATPQGTVSKQVHKKIEIKGKPLDQPVLPEGKDKQSLMDSLSSRLDNLSVEKIQIRQQAACGPIRKPNFSSNTCTKMETSVFWAVDKRFGVSQYRDKETDVDDHESSVKNNSVEKENTSLLTLSDLAKSGKMGSQKELSKLPVEMVYQGDKSDKNQNKVSLQDRQSNMITDSLKDNTFIDDFIMLTLEDSTPQNMDQHVAKPSILARILCLKLSKKSENKIYRNIRFKFSHQIKISPKRIEQVTRQIIPFDFGSPSPDDIVKAKQKQAFTRSGNMN